MGLSHIVPHTYSSRVSYFVSTVTRSVRVRCHLVSSAVLLEEGIHMFMPKYGPWPFSVLAHEWQDILPRPFDRPSVPLCCAALSSDRHDTATTARRTSP
jgi:hypothetical protein